jgi:hypothetical protein
LILLELSEGNFFPLSIGDYKNKAGDNCVGIYYSWGDFIVYNPKTGIFELESKAIPDLWFRNVYPNPVNTPSRTLTADIMCYLSDVSNTEIGLYDFNGRQVLDLSDRFEYNQTTATIYLTFDAPPTISKGTYFIVVKSGNETRSHSIIIE